jgi:hypothetical protein
MANDRSCIPGLGPQRGTIGQTSENESHEVISSPSNSTTANLRVYGFNEVESMRNITGVLYQVSRTNDRHEFSSALESHSANPNASVPPSTSVVNMLEI